MSTDLSQYATQEPADLLWFEKANYIAVNVGLIAYGMLIISVFSCAYHLFQEKDAKKNLKWMLFVVVLFTCGTFNISVNMKFNEWAWIDYRAYPGGPLMFLLEQQANPINIKGNAISIVVGFLTDALLIYRVHVVYQKWYVIVVPILTWLAMSVLGALFVFQAAQPESSLWAHTTLNFSLPYFSIAMGLNILLTGMLVSRLLFMRWKITKALGSRHGETYTNIVSMILESAAPYGIVSFIFLILYTTGNTAALLFIPLLIQVQCISPILIILRVARGRAWTSNTISQSNLSRMKFEKQSGPVKINSATVVNSDYGGHGQDVSLGTFKVSSTGSHIYSKETGTMGSVV